MIIWMIVPSYGRAKWGSKVSHMFSYFITFAPYILRMCQVCMAYGVFMEFFMKFLIDRCLVFTQNLYICIEAIEAIEVNVYDTDADTSV